MAHENVLELGTNVHTTIVQASKLPITRVKHCGFGLKNAPLAYICTSNTHRAPSIGIKNRTTLLAEAGRGTIRLYRIVKGTLIDKCGPGKPLPR